MLKIKLLLLDDMEILESEKGKKEMLQPPPQTSKLKKHTFRINAEVRKLTVKLGRRIVPQSVGLSRRRVVRQVPEHRGVASLVVDPLGQLLHHLDEVALFLKHMSRTSERTSNLHWFSHSASI